MILNDYLVTIESISADESRSKELTIAYSFLNTPFGEALIASTSKGVCYLAFADDREQTLGELKMLFPHTGYSNRTDAYQQQALPFFTDDWKNLKPINLHLKGTEFQLKVWKLLLQIPPAGLTTYNEIARRMGNPKASRAVGTAVGSNPVSFLIPCHRVIRSDGALGGYHWGLPRKINMIDWEKARYNQFEINGNENNNI
ncbi:Bifunctional transcriptional activator/DNA repair enzyme Ada [termite gut metagenome]|uniref:methylated-DNA--[protein]-cysteine S-methyltransferase n=1 Tax=termite gut metagenome TaxID=433724 RepID=A0A5J4PRI7_9ZZZZ